MLPGSQGACKVFLIGSVILSIIFETTTSLKNTGKLQYS